jgi:hypothetical protein
MGTFAHAQKKQGIYVDPSGVIRWEKDHKEAVFFGVNYTAPFAYGNRAITRMGITAEQAIKEDIYHFSRLGLDAFRVHVWDTEISDSLGNLLNNEHLRLFDFLIAELKKRKIKILITPIAFWGNGYPEKDERTHSFSDKFGKKRALVEEDAFKAQENYLKQFIKHKNQYTGLTYGQDQDVIATEVNNEPQHSGSMERATEYVNRMVVAIRSTGWTKPIFYNISESPKYAGAIVKANVQGHSFQWYPTGLVAGHTLQGNYLPNVSKYIIPFDSIPAFKNRAKVVYEFDAGDVLASYMYPAMAKSFRVAGFQWATQFAYDPMATAYANTEYQTHYLNLAYTPSKAISLLIASKVFHQLKRSEPILSDTLFGAFRLDYKNSLSEINTNQEFYHSNPTVSKPKNLRTLQHLAGVGTSPVVIYQGKGAYFLDQVKPGIWRLEVMPDAIQIKDPFEKASPTKEVTRINWATLPIAIDLPDLGKEFTVKGLNQGNSYSSVAAVNEFNISPGAYLLVKKNQVTNLNANSSYGNIKLGSYYAPKSIKKEISVKHSALQSVSENVSFNIQAEIVGLDTKDSAFVTLSNSSNQWKKLPLVSSKAYVYVAAVPSDLVKPGVLDYHILIQKHNGEYLIFPSGEKGNPYAWDRPESITYHTYIAKKHAMLEIFNAATDGKTMNIYNPDWENNRVEYISDQNPLQLDLKLSMNKPVIGVLMGWQSFFADKTAGRISEPNDFKTLVIKARSTVKNTKVRIGLIGKNAQFYAAEVLVNNEFKLIEIPLNQLKPANQLLLPRPYPAFLPLYYKSTLNQPFQLKEAEKLEVTFGYDKSNQPISLEIESIYLK